MEHISRELLPSLQDEFTPKKRFGEDLRLPQGEKWREHLLPRAPRMAEPEGFIRTVTIDKFQGEESKVLSPFSSFLV